MLWSRKVYIKNMEKRIREKRSGFFQISTTLTPPLPHLCPIPTPSHDVTRYPPPLSHSYPISTPHLPHPYPIPTPPLPHPYPSLPTSTLPLPHPYPSLPHHYPTTTQSSDIAFVNIHLSLTVCFKCWTLALPSLLECHSAPSLSSRRWSRFSKSPCSRRIWRFWSASRFAASHSLILSCTVSLCSLPEENEMEWEWEWEWEREWVREREREREREWEWEWEWQLEWDS